MSFANLFQHLERSAFLVLLRPFEELALEVDIGLLQLLHVDVDVDDAVDDDVFGEVEAAVKVDGTHQGLESIAAYRLEAATRVTLVFNQVEQPNLLRQLVQTGTAHNLGAQLGKETLPLIGVLAVEELRHDGTQDSVAQVFETLVVDAMAVLRGRRGTVSERHMIQLCVAGDITKNILEETIELLTFFVLPE